TLLLWFIIVPLTFLGFLTVLLGIILPPSGAILGPILAHGTHATLWLVDHLARIPYTLLPGRNPSIWWVLACYGLLGWIMAPQSNQNSEAVIANSERSRRGRSLLSLFAIRYSKLLLATILLVCWLIPPRWININGSRGALNVWMLAVGGGTGTIIELPDG